MTERGLMRRVEFWRRRVCPEWRVAVMPDPHPNDEGSLAHVESDPMIAEIRVHFTDEVLELDKVAADRVIVHELVHPLLDRVLDHDQALKPFVGSVPWEVYVETRRDDMEEFVDRMARAIVSATHGEAQFYTGHGEPNA